jgi:hypothetical protein
MTEDADLLERFVPSILGLPDREGNGQVYYATFHHVNEDARVVLVGITPGWSQTQLIFRRTRHHLLQGSPPAEASRRAAQEARFAGPMRTNITSMLDELDVPGHLGIPAAKLFASEHARLLHMTSAVRYPAFVDRQNYSGYSPPLLESGLLRGYIQTKLASELGRLQHALVVPFGSSVSSAVGLLAREGLLDARQCLVGCRASPAAAGARGAARPRTGPSLLGEA